MDLGTLQVELLKLGITGPQLNRRFATIDAATPIAQWDASSLSDMADGDSVYALADATGRGNTMVLPSSSYTAPTKRTRDGKTVLRFTGSATVLLQALGMGTSWPFSHGMACPLTFVANDCR